jgi:hypothetical protein
MDDIRMFQPLFFYLLFVVIDFIIMSLGKFPQHLSSFPRFPHWRKTRAHRKPVPGL